MTPLARAALVPLVNAGLGACRKSVKSGVQRRPLAPIWAVAPSGGQIFAKSTVLDCCYGASRGPTASFSRLWGLSSSASLQLSDVPSQWRGQTHRRVKPASLVNATKVGIVKALRDAWSRIDRETHRAIVQVTAPSKCEAEGPISQINPLNIPTSR